MRVPRQTLPVPHPVRSRGELEAAAGLWGLCCDPLREGLLILHKPEAERKHNLAGWLVKGQLGEPGKPCMPEPQPCPPTDA